MSLIWAILRPFGIRVDLEMLTGTFFNLMPSATVEFLGFIIHLLVSGAIGLLYATCFEYISRRAGIAVGVAFGGIHAVIGGLAVGAIGAVHPLVPEVLSPPGAFLSDYGAFAIFMFFFVHLLYGAIVGWLYKPVLHPFGHQVHA